MQIFGQDVNMFLIARKNMYFYINCDQDLSRSKTAFLVPYQYLRMVEDYLDRQRISLP